MNAKLTTESHSNECSDEYPKIVSVFVQQHVATQITVNVLAMNIYSDSYSYYLQYFSA